MPEIRSLPGFVEPEVIQDPDAARFRMFDAYAQFMRRLGEQAPLVVVLEDLHWADRPTLQLLQHLARELVSSRVLVIATYRDTDITRASPRRPQQSRAPSSAGRFLGASLTSTSGRRPDGLMAPHRLAAVWRKHWKSTVSGEAIPDASITRRQPRWKFRGLQGVPTPEGKIQTMILPGRSELELPLVLSKPVAPRHLEDQRGRLDGAAVRRPLRRVEHDARTRSRRSRGSSLGIPVHPDTIGGLSDSRVAGGRMVRATRSLIVRAAQVLRAGRAALAASILVDRSSTPSERQVVSEARLFEPSVEPRQAAEP